MNAAGENSLTKWDIALSGWIIQDGSYPDFEVGQTVEFALQFWLPQGATAQASGGEVTAHNLGHGLYDSVAEVILQTDQVTILDIGVLVYQHALSQQARLPERSRIAIQLGLGVDACSYFEALTRSGDVLPMVYSWKILSILMQTATFKKAGKLLYRDPQRLGYQEILKTDAWKDDSGHAEYVLRCDLLPIPPKRTSATARP